MPRNYVLLRCLCNRGYILIEVSRPPDRPTARPPESAVLDDEDRRVPLHPGRDDAA